MNAVEERLTSEAREEFLDRNVVMKKNRDYRVLQRIRDVVLSLAALLILWPVMLLLALIIVIDSPGAGPVFAQTRVGLDGKEFRFYKFRSMHPNAEARLEELLEYNEMEGPVLKIKEDPRITRIGKFLRKSSIDELPQLINVIKGDMSIVGPRPALPREVEQYTAYEKQRLYVAPGLTCYWQITPNRNGLSFRDWVALDVKYIKERSFLTDLKIMFKTFGAIFGMNGV